jgi:hypothetical protein
MSFEFSDLAANFEGASAVARPAYEGLALMHALVACNNTTRCQAITSRGTAANKLRV